MWKGSLLELEKLVHSACQREVEMFIYRMAFPQLLQTIPQLGLKAHML